MTMDLRRLALYIGGFMGPFGTVVIVPMFPELREEYSASPSAVNLGFSLYLLTFAVLLLFSGTLGERWGRRRTVRATYLLYATASILCAFAPSLEVFLAGRALQGVANAFITPLLLAGLAEIVSEERFGREVGIYSSFQALGAGMGPIVGGIAADTDWRFAFVGTAIVALLLSLVPPDGEPQTASVALRPLLTRRMVTTGVAFFFAAAGPIGIAVLVGVAARDEFNLSGTTAGVILFFGSMSALVCGPLWGRLLDRFGASRAALFAALGATLATSVLAASVGRWSLGLIWLVAGGIAASPAVVFQALGATIMPSNRGGALSFLLSFRFVGHAVGPLIFVPFLDNSLPLTFLAAASLGLVTLLLLRSTFAPAAAA